MTMINVQLELAGIDLVKPFAGPPKNIGFLSSITPDPILVTAFLTGTGLASSNIIVQTPQDPPVDLNYDTGKIKQRRDHQKNALCTVIAAVGGAITSAAVAGDAGATYVSLVGSTDGIDSNIKGGVSLDSYKLNAARREYLKSLSTTYGNSNIVLYTNKNSQMHGAEVNAWSAVNPFVESAAGTPTGNDPTKFAADFVATGAFGAGGLQSGAKALVISDDPFFRASRGELIKQLNIWLNGDPTRKVVYPSQIYGSPVLTDLVGTPQPPNSGQSILYGPDLIAAYHLLGTLARCCFENPTVSPGFVSAVPFIVPL